MVIVWFKLLLKLFLKVQLTRTNIGSDNFLVANRGTFDIPFIWAMSKQSSCQWFEPHIKHNFTKVFIGIEIMSFILFSRHVPNAVWPDLEFIDVAFSIYGIL